VVFITPLTGDRAINFAGTPVKTIFVIHGIGDGPTDVQRLADNVAGADGVDALRFRVAPNFDYHACAAVGNTGCGGDCSIPKVAAQLADYVAANSPAGGDVILVGFSMGGLVSRDLILNNYKSVLTGRTVSLVTLGTPNLGYPFTVLDDNAFCPNLVTAMDGNWRTMQVNQWPALSGYLWGMTQSWQSGSFPGTNGFWLAASGRSCSNPKRTTDSSTGCQDSAAYSDGVVCAQSAGYDITDQIGIAPNLRWPDPYARYVHSTAAWGLGTELLFCPNDQTEYVLSDPPIFDDLFITLVAMLNGR
jgi:pimeloyl-ACP methyl ester carboxylesterase